MKIQFYPLLLLFFLLACTSNELPNNTATQTVNKQTHFSLQDQFKTDLTHYFNSYNQGDWREVIETTYPKIYGNKTDEEIMTDFVRMNMSGIKRSIDFGEIEKVSSIIEDAQHKYAKIFYNAFVSVELDDKAVQNKENIQTNLELSYDTPDVKYDESTQTFFIDAYNSIIAIADKSAKNTIWKYIEVDKQKEPYYAQVIPQNILDQLN